MEIWRFWDPDSDLGPCLRLFLSKNSYVKQHRHRLMERNLERDQLERMLRYI